MADDRRTIYFLPDQAERPMLGSGYAGRSSGGTMAVPMPEGGFRKVSMPWASGGAGRGSSQFDTPMPIQGSWPMRDGRPFTSLKDVPDVVPGAPNRTEVGVHPLSPSGNTAGCIGIDGEGNYHRFSSEAAALAAGSTPVSVAIGRPSSLGRETVPESGLPQLSLLGQGAAQQPAGRPQPPDGMDAPTYNEAPPPAASPFIASAAPKSTPLDLAGLAAPAEQSPSASIFKAAAAPFAKDEPAKAKAGIDDSASVKAANEASMNWWQQKRKSQFAGMGAA